jgi:precorrin-3B methylase
MAINDTTLDDLYNPNAQSSKEDLAEDMEILENFQADVKAIAGWNILNKDNDEHLVLLQCSYLFGETVRLWRNKLSGADTG